MPVSAVTLAKLIAAGLTGQHLIDVVASIDADMAMSTHSPSQDMKSERSPAAMRQARYRARNKMGGAAGNTGDEATRAVMGDVTSNVTRDVTRYALASTTVACEDGGSHPLQPEALDPSIDVKARKTRRCGAKSSKLDRRDVTPTVFSSVGGGEIQSPRGFPS